MACRSRDARRLIAPLVALSFAVGGAWSVAEPAGGDVPVVATIPNVTFVSVDAYPSAVAIDPATETVYTVSNLHNDVTFLGGAGCNATDTSDCLRIYPRQDVGVEPTALAIDQATKTMYVTNFTGATRGTSVSVLSTSRCNAARPAGCTRFPHLPPTVPLPFEPNDVAINETTQTIYVDGDGHDLAVIDGRRCRGGQTAGCRRAAHIARVRAGAGAVAVNARTNTVYVVDYSSGVVSVLDGRTCRAGETSGCDRVRALIHVGRHPWRATVDAMTNTVYVTNFGARTVSVIDGRQCDARTIRGCRRRPAVIRVGREPEAVAVDHRRRLGFVTNAADDTVSVFDTSTCNAATSSGCSVRPRTVRVGSMPTAIAVDERSGTVYAADNGADTLALFASALPPG